MVHMLKKWWLMAVVLTLAMSLTSCSTKKKTRALQSGEYYNACGGGYPVEVVVQPTGQRDMYNVIIVPTNQNRGDQVAIGFGSSMGTCDDRKSSVAMIPGQEIVIPSVSLYEMSTYPILVIAPNYVGDPLSSVCEREESELTTYCQIPVPGYTN